MMIFFGRAPPEKGGSGLSLQSLKKRKGFFKGFPLQPLTQNNLKCINFYKSKPFGKSLATKYICIKNKTAQWHCQNKKYCVEKHSLNYDL